jgi:hypothetical protein
LRQTIASGKEKDKAAMHFTGGVQQRGEAEAAAPGKLVLKRACVGVLWVQRGVQELEREFK